MSIAAAILLVAQSATPLVADQVGARGRGAVATVRASVRILKPARITFELPENVEAEGRTRSEGVQRSRDQAGTIWIEFS